jgi:hypothetical protein
VISLVGFDIRAPALELAFDLLAALAAATIG